MLKLSISARFSTGMKLSWNADDEEGKRRKQENRLKKQESKNVLVRETETRRKTEKEREGVGKSEHGNKKWQIL